MRCYNGAPDAQLQALMDERVRLRKELKSADPDAHVTYFPMEGEVAGVGA